MPSKIVFALAPVGLLAGVNGIHVLIDGERCRTTQFGETVEFDVSPGPHTFQAVLDAVLERPTKVLELQVADDTTVSINGKYSRLWGNIKLKRA